MWTRKNTARFAHVPFNFISLYVCVFTFTMKLKDPNYKSYWNILVFCDQWKMMSDVSMSDGKTCHLALSLLFGFPLVITLRNSVPESHWNTLILFDKKDMTSDLNISIEKLPDFGVTFVIKLGNFNF